MRVHFIHIYMRSPSSMSSHLQWNITDISNVILYVLTLLIFYLNTSIQVLTFQHHCCWYLIRLNSRGLVDSLCAEYISMLEQNMYSFKLISFSSIVSICVDHFHLPYHNFPIVILSVSCRLPAPIARFMGPTWGPPGSCRPQVGPM